MKKLALIILASASLAILGLTTAPTAEADNPCARKVFKTTYVKNACNKDQAEAKKAMKKFLSKAKKVNAQIKNCKSCHTDLQPRYQLNGNGLQLFQSAFAKVKNQL